MASKTPSKSGKKPKAKTTGSSGKNPGKTAPKPAVKTATATLARPSRLTSVIDDDDKLMAVGAGGGAGFGRCGGRVLGSRLEQNLCDRLSNAGVAHSHAPRRFEVRLGEKQVGAYAPMVVLRGRGREGKSVVVEAAEHADSPSLKKVEAFRAQYGQEFYVIMVASEEVLDDVALATYDEACSTTAVHALISRLAE